MASRVKGITLEIGGNVTGLDKALRDINSRISGTQKELKDVNRLLKLDPGNTELLAQKQKLLQDAVKETREKLNQLKEADQQAKKQLEAGELGQDKYNALQREIIETEQKLESLEKQAKDSGDGLQRAMQDVNSRMKDTQDNLKEVDRLLKLDPGNAEMLAQKQNLLRDAIGQTKEKLEQLKEADRIAKEQLESGDLGKEDYDALQREIVETEEQLKSLQKEAKDFGSVVGQELRAAGDKISGVGDKISGAGEKMTKSVTVPVVGVGTAVTKIAMDFEAQMSKVSAISGATGKDFDKLKEKAEEMGGKTKFSATEAAEAFEYMAMAGWKTEDMVSGIDGILNLAAAAGTDLATTSDIVTDALTGFGLAAEDAGHFADIMAAASSNANTNVEMMGETFKYVAPVAGALGYSAEDVSVAVGLMANSGIKASQAGTSLRTLLTNMAKPTDEMAAAMNTLGISLDDGQGNMKSFREIMDDLRSGFGELKIPAEDAQAALEELELQLADGTITQEDYDKAIAELTERCYGAEGAMKAQAAASLAGKEGMSGLLAIVNASEEDYNKLTEAINNCDGVSGSMAETMQDNLQGQIQDLSSKLEQLALSLAKTLLPNIKDGVGWIQKAVVWFNDLSPATQDLIVKIGMILAVVGPALLIAGKVISAIGGIVGGIGSLVGAIGGISGAIAGAGGLLPLIGGVVTAAAPFLIGGAIIAGVVAGGYMIIKHWDDIKAAAGKVKDDVAENWNYMSASISGKWSEIKQNTSESLENIKTDMSTNWQSMKDSVRESASNIKETVSGKWDETKQKTSEAWGNIKSDVAESWRNMKDSTTAKGGEIFSTVSDKFSAIYDKISEKIGGARDFVRNAIEAIKGFFDFEWHLPELRLPHIKVGEYIDVPVLGTIPNPATLHVEWYKKAMDDPRILKGASIFGYNNGKLLGGGEAGEEVVSGKETLLNMIREAVASVQKVQQINLAGAMRDALQAANVHVSYGDVHMTVYGAEGQDVNELAEIVSYRLKDSYEREKAVWK